MAIHDEICRSIDRYKDRAIALGREIHAHPELKFEERFAAQKRSAPTPMSDQVTGELRELVRLRTRYVDELSDRMRQLHRAVDLGFPEFTRHVRIKTLLAIVLLARYPTARSFAAASIRKLASLAYDGRHHVGEALARSLIDGAKVSVGSRHSEPFQLWESSLPASVASARGLRRA